ncbi:MAG: ACP S-malonyltransferase [Chloroflexota bacterium]|nr:ACP S-malonyltransferase [Chloroflexota bacterium]
MGAGLPTAGQMFALAERISGLPITALAASGPLERLTATDIAQLAVVAHSVAALVELRQQLQLEFAAVAGHSVGEYAAYVAADALDSETALRLVHVRAQAMAAACQAVDGAMAAVIGLDETALREACAAASRDGSSVELANLNSPGQLIVSGARDAIERLSGMARGLGARRVLPLTVGGPFHSVYMRPAAEPLRQALAKVELQPARVPVVANASAQPIQDPQDLRHELAVQVYSPVLWTESLRQLAAMGCDRFLEVGPGSVLAGLVKRTLPEATVASFGSLAELEAARTLTSLQDR